MRHRRLFLALLAPGIALVVVSVAALSVVRPAEAQCGSQASSCKNCHETQGKDPVNSDGTGWHESHAFGDFCYICHGGNNQAMEEVSAHAGMVDPMSDIQVACGQCHPNDLQAKADVYNVKLGIKAGATSVPALVSTPTALAATEAPATSAATAIEPQATLAANDANLVNYVARYNERVLNRYPTNWGNVILGVLIAAMVVGGGAMVIKREGLVRISFTETKPVPGEYPTDVVEMLPDLAKLKPGMRRSLQRLLNKPAAAAKLLDAVDKLTGEEEDEQSD